MRPAIQPNSKPPTLARISMASLGSGWLTSRARRTTLIFFFRRSSEIFVPRPVTSSGVLPQQTAAMAALAVVLAMPISPGSIQSQPLSMMNLASTRPVLMDATACSRVMAGPFVMFFVPAAMRSGKRLGMSDSAAAMPRSATSREEPAYVEKTLAAAPLRIV